MRSSTKAWKALKECDDGNLIEDDGCSSLCEINTGWVCSGGTPSQPDKCYEYCGDGINYGALQCDDGNLIDGDGCSSNCKIEPGWTCIHPGEFLPSIC